MAALLSAAPAFAASAPIPAAGITPNELAQLMRQHGWPAKITHDSDGNLIISSRAADVNFDMYFYQCRNGRCTDIQFAAGWSGARVAPDKVNQWNRTKRFLRTYWKPGNILWTEMDARISRGTTANVEEYLALWPEMLDEFKPFMGL
jgi:hypothetical protein